jgi:hypothetical protein
VFSARLEREIVVERHHPLHFGGRDTEDIGYLPQITFTQVTDLALEAV